MSFTSKELQPFLKMRYSFTSLFKVDEAMRPLQQTLRELEVVPGLAFAALLQKIADQDVVKTFTRLNQQMNHLQPIIPNGSPLGEQLKIASRFCSFARESTLFRQSSFLRSPEISRQWLSSIDMLKPLAELDRTLKDHNFADLLNSRSPAVELILQQRYRGLNTSESIGALLKRLYGLSLDIDNDSATSADSATLLELPDELLQLPPDQALEKTSVQIWLSRIPGYARKAVHTILIQWLLLTIVAGTGNDIVKDLAKCILPVNIAGECSSRQARKEIQNIVSAENRWENLKNFRLVSRDNVHLRTGPSERSAILEKLPINTLLFIRDKSNRQWLAVEVEFNGEIVQGWISRRYTLPLHQH